MQIQDFIDIIESKFYTGVPDSQLKALCDYLVNTYGVNNKHHIIAANEGNAVALAAGFHLSTGEVPVVYMQNSGEGNVINPIASLLDNHVYGIPVIFIIGWRGEPGIPDEPQHIYQGEITCKLLEDMGIEYAVFDKNTSVNEFKAYMNDFRAKLKLGNSVAVVVRKGALSYEEKVIYSNNNSMSREEIIEHITKYTGNDPVVATTGKAGRELFEIRERDNESHQYDFLTIGSMGHASSIAMGIAINKPDKKVWCIDGDGAVIMHMGAMAVIGANKPSNMVHIVINNGAHETVGGMQTAAGAINLKDVAKACGYQYITSVDNFKDLDLALVETKSLAALAFIEVKSSIGAREDLGRPTTTPKENKIAFMENLKNTN